MPEIEIPDQGLSAGAVAGLLGIAVTTVRTWDRRYGLGPETREAGRHRRYRAADLERLRLMRRLVDDGLAPARAAHIAKSVRDPARLDGETTSRRERVTPSATAVGLRRAALALDPAELDRLLRRALGDGVVRAWRTSIAPALRELGRRHASAGRYIAAEHLLSAAASVALARVDRPASPPRVLLACTPEEQHSLPLEALAAALAERGVASRVLGARVPTSALCDAAARTAPMVVVLWAHAEETADAGHLAAVTGLRPRPALVLACGPGWSPADVPEGVCVPADLQEALDVTTTLPLTAPMKESER